MKLYVIRHGQTEWNVAGKCQGMTDIELNSTGKEQAKKISEQIKNYKIDLIICSPLKRARATAEIINEVVNCIIINDERIIERNCGNLEGTTEKEWDSIIGDNVDVINNYNLNWNGQNIEPIQDVCKRVWNLLDEIQEKYKDKNVLIVTHSAVSRVIHYLLGIIPEDGDLSKIDIPNLRIIEYKL